MYIEDYGQQRRRRVGITRRDLQRLMSFMEMAVEDADATIVVGLTPENGFSWEVPDPGERLRSIGPVQVPDSGGQARWMVCGSPRADVWYTTPQGEYLAVETKAR
jgi:hypothetical protein